MLMAGDTATAVYVTWAWQGVVQGMISVRQAECSVMMSLRIAAVTKSNDFIDAKQDEPYGDIILTRGSYL